ncbi:cysteine rich repeat-containing protein [Bradyrhizobium sp.]|nr:cysteine rich repeat-containing protein [Bradyrhizobium sp.]
MREACKADFKKFCSGVSPGGGRIVECLNKQHDSLSEACKTALDARSKQ